MCVLSPRPFLLLCCLSRLCARSVKEGTFFLLFWFPRSLHIRAVPLGCGTKAWLLNCPGNCVGIQSFSKKQGNTPLSINHEGPTKFSTPVDYHHLTVGGLLFPSTKWVISPSPPPLPCLISLHHPMMRRLTVQALTG